MAYLNQDIIFYQTALIYKVFCSQTKLANLYVSSSPEFKSLFRLCLGRSVFDMHLKFR